MESPRQGPPSPRLAHQAGFSLIELMVATAILATIFATVGTVFAYTSRAFAEQTVSTQLGIRGQLLIDRVVEDLIEADLETVLPQDPQGSTSIRFQKVMSVVDGEAVHGDPIVYDLDPATGGVRRWIDASPTGSTPGPEDVVTIIEADIAANGLRFTRNGTVFFIDADLAQDHEGRHFDYQISSAARVRNVL